MALKAAISFCTLKFGDHMAYIHKDKHSIRYMYVVSSNRVHSFHSCEANKCRIFKPFFVYQIKGFRVLLSKKNLKKINLRVRFLALKIAFLGGGGLKMIIF